MASHKLSRKAEGLQTWGGGGGEGEKTPNRLCLGPPVFPIKCSGNLWRSGCLSCPSFHLDPACLDPGALSPAVTVKCFFTDGRAKRCYGRKQKGFFWLELNLVWKGDRVRCERRNVLNPECEEYFFCLFFSLPCLISTLWVGLKTVDDIENTLITLVLWVLLHVLRPLMKLKKKPNPNHLFSF